MARKKRADAPAEEEQGAQGAAAREPAPKAKRRRAAAADGAPAGAAREQRAPDDAAAPQNEGAVDRREQMAEIARRRAAHFAHFAADDEEAEQNAHTGGSEARKLGPWSSAVELIEARAEAAAKRQGRLSDAAREAAGGPVGAGPAWQPRRDPALGPRPPRCVPPLFAACVRLLTEHVEDVESLWGLPDDIKVRLAASVCAQRKLTPEAARLFTEGGPDEVVLPDCTQLAQEELVAALLPAATPRLERLELNLCGRGLSDAAAKALARAPLPALRVLRLGGAYRLGDAGLLALLQRARGLRELHLPQCCRVAGPALQQLPALTPDLRVLSLADCRGLSGAALRLLLCGPGGLASLESLALDSIAEVDCQLVAELCLALPRLARLSLAFCALVADAGVRGVAAACGPRLRELRLDECARVTDAGLLALSEACPDLEVLSLQRCHKVTDVGLASVASRGRLRLLNANKVHALGQLTMQTLATACGETLEEADLSWCREVSDDALGLLADSCPRLRRLTLFGCSQVTERFLHGHSNEGLQVIGANAQKAPAPGVARLKLLLEEE